MGPDFEPSDSPLLVVISSIALMVGGIGVMAIMTDLGDRADARIGVRKAIGARRREILVQFLIEAVVPDRVGGILGPSCWAAPSASARPLALGIPGLAALVVIRDRYRLLRDNRDLLRPLPGNQGVAAGPDRSVAVRVEASASLPRASAPAAASSRRAKPVLPVGRRRRAPVDT